MARRIPGQDEKEETAKPLEMRTLTEEEQSQAATKGIPGGAPGIVLEARQSVAFPGQSLPGKAPAKSAGAGEHAVVEAFRVAGNGPHCDGSWPIMYGGVRTYLRPGKVVTSSTYDLAYLRAQGVKLEAV